MPSNITPAGTVIQGLPIGIRTWQVPTATSGTDTTCVVGFYYYGSIQVPGETVVSGISYLIGSVGGTDKVIASIHDIAGNVIASSAIAGTIVGTAANTQDLDLILPVTLQPNYYLIALQFNNTPGTAKYRTVPAFTSGGMLGGSIATAGSAFVTPANFIPSTTRFTADKAPVAHLYAK